MTDLVFTGPPAFVGRLVQLLRDEGVEVTYQPPLETKGVGDQVVSVALGIAGAYAKDAVDAAVRAAWRRYKAKDRPGTLEIDGEEVDGS